ncbi:50S ribosomal protein L18 [Candidatus Bathyarchaeota archaeon]|nr:50S ribosomal protein L18 [Candidatus Bathyarchaeota archaeon]
MAKSSRYCAPFRRRQEGKTDYRTRRALILSGQPRLVARASITNILAQVIAAKPHGDEVLVSAQSRELEKYDWKAPRGNIPAAYLTGLLCGLKAKAKGIENAVLDIGLQSPSKGARIFAILKGVVDAGVELPYGEEKLPDEKRIAGGHIAEYAKSLASEAEEYQSRFSQYLKQGVTPEKLPEHFAKVKKDILAAFKSGGKKK